MHRRKGNAFVERPAVPSLLDEQSECPAREKFLSGGQTVYTHKKAYFIFRELAEDNFQGT